MQEDTGLNILAISIFTITLTVLGGPIFHISPFIPATVTFVGLSLVTVDTLAWQNQGTNLLINLFVSQEQKERIIYHEAGHFLLAHIYNIPIVGYTLTPWEALKAKMNNPGSGGVVFDTSFLAEQQKNLREINVTIDNFAVVLMAGIAAEKIIFDNSQGGQEDRQLFNSLYRDLGLRALQSQTKQRFAILQAQTIIEENKESYLALVEAMRQRLSVHECQQIIRQKSLNFTPSELT